MMHGDPTFAGEGNGSRSIELDGQSQVVKPAAPPPTAAPSAAAARSELARAMQLVEERRWVDAAPGLHRAWKATALSPGERDLASYELAVSLYQAKLHQSAFRIFGEIADQPMHGKHEEALVWLGRLSMHLPEPADVIERVGKYEEAAIDAARQRALRATTSSTESPLFYSELDYLLGRYKYRNRDFEGAARVMTKIDVRSPRYVKAQFFSGLASVQLRKPVPAVLAFQRVIRVLDARASAHTVTASDEGAESTMDDDRLRDLAYLSMARTYYTAAIVDGGSTGIITDQARLGLAIKYWNKVDAGGPFWLDALFEESWARFWLGDYERVLGNIHTLDAPYFPRSYFPEAGILKSLVYYLNCHYTDAETLTFRFQQTWQPYRDDLLKLRERFRDEDPASVGVELLKSIRDGRDEPGPRDGKPGVRLPYRLRRLAEMTLTDRDLSRHLQYIQMLDDEHRKIERMPPSFRDSALGEELKEGILLAHDLALQNANELARERIQRKLSELDDHLLSSRRLLLDIASARKRRPEVGATATDDGHIRALDDGDEHVLWPFTGEYWRDELGQYKQVITSKCGEIQNLEPAKH